VPEAFLRVGTRTVAVCVFLLLIAGALVTSTQSGLAVPDWPLSYGKVMPPMVGGILYEHGHRLVAAAVSTLVGLEMAMLFFFERRRTVKVLGAVAFGAILMQALLGGLTVLFLLPPAVSSAHAALAEIVFALTAVVALLCSNTWKTQLATAGAAPRLLKEVPVSPLPLEEDLRNAFRSVVLATGAVFVQIVLGAVMRHTGAGLAIPDFPTFFGAWLPSASELARSGVPVHLAHRVGALVVVVLVAFAARALAALPGPLFPTLGAAWTGLVCLQALLGASSIWSGRAVPLTVAHLAVGALCWVTGVLLSVALVARFSYKLGRD
jgi:cytochrome c oxidase assembly protein subunit 15